VIADTERRTPWLAVGLAAIAVGLVVLGFVYFVTKSADLPHYLPGHYEPSSVPGHVAQARKHHVGLGLLCFALAVLAFITAWLTAATESPD
jgi:hypothetical protein